MGKSDKFKARKASAFKRKLGNLEERQGKKEPLIVLSFKDFDHIKDRLLQNGNQITY